MDFLKAENHDPVYQNRLKNRASKQVQDNFNGVLYTNQQLPMQPMAKINSNQRFNSVRRNNHRTSDMRYGKPSNDGRTEGEGALGKKRIGGRNDFMGNVYQQLESNIHKELVDMPITIQQQLPILNREEALYPASRGGTRRVNSINLAPKYQNQ